jgi:hypothetical protein
MPKFIPLTESDVTFTFELEAEYESVRGHFGYDACPSNTAAEDAIIERLEAGDTTAWCYIKVTATAHDGTEEIAGLGCCVLEDCRGKSGTAVARIVEAFARDSGIHLEALDRLNATLAAARQCVTFRMCTTKYLGPTNSRGARVKATHCTTGRSATLAWDYALDSFDNHAAAAEPVLGRYPEISTATAGGGYIMGVDPHYDP